MSNTGKTTGVCTNKDNFTFKGIITRPQDYIAVAGSAEGSVDFKAVRNNFYESIGNRYRFINQAIRALYTFPEPQYDCNNIAKIQRILVVFQFKYTNNDILKINKYAEEANARVIYVHNVDEFINFLNKRKEKQREIKRMEIYSHGIIGHFSFHYRSEKFWESEHPREKEGLLDAKKIDKIDHNIFNKTAAIISYACRTGINIDKEFFAENEDAGQSESLAQYMANKLNVTVQAFEKRSSYKDTYTRKIRRKYVTQTDYDGFAGLPIEVSAEQISYHHDNKEYKTLSDLNKSSDERESNKRDGGGPIMKKGAWNKPSTGEYPKGLKDGLQIYTPQK